VELDALELLKQDHQRVKELFEQCEMSKLSPSSEKFKPKFKVLKDDVEHHAEEEEGKNVS